MGGACRLRRCLQGWNLATTLRCLRQWMPLMMEGRSDAEPVAATRAADGTDLDFGALTRGLLAALVEWCC